MLYFTAVSEALSTGGNFISVTIIIAKNPSREVRVQSIEPVFIAFLKIHAVKMYSKYFCLYSHT